jgi:hypothetical protein
MSFTNFALYLRPDSEKRSQGQTITDMVCDDLQSTKQRLLPIIDERFWYSYNFNGDRILTHICKRGSFRLFKWLVEEQGGKDYLEVSNYDTNESALQIVIEKGSIRFVEYLLKILPSAYVETVLKDVEIRYQDYEMEELFEEYGYLIPKTECI